MTIGGEAPGPGRGHTAAPGPGPAPVPMLFLIGDTGGGHRSAAQAVAQALGAGYPGRFAPVIYDALRGPAAPLSLRWQTGLYGPGIRLTPWLWSFLFRSFSSPRALRWYRRTLFAAANRSVAAAVAAHRPAVIAAFHGFTAGPAIRARDRSAPGTPVITVITDLTSAHLAWRDAPVDRIVAPSAQVARCCAADGLPEGRYLEIGLPVAAEFCAAPPDAAERLALRRSLGLSGRPFVAVLTGGAEGSGGLYRRAAAVLRRLDDVDVVVICGRNRMLRRRLARLAARADGRLTVQGFVSNMADWLRCADVVVGKAGPSTIAEAACCAAPLVLTSYVPGNEDGNVEFVASAGAGRYAPRPRDLVAEIGSLRRDPAALAAMRAASAGLSRPGAAADIARLLARAADAAGTADPPGTADAPGTAGAADAAGATRAADAAGTGSALPTVLTGN